MEYRLLTGFLVLGLTGCFSEPPSGSSSGDGSSGNDSTGSNSSSGGDASSETTEVDPSASTSAADTGSTGEACDVFSFDVPNVDADVVVLVDTDTEFQPLDVLAGTAGLADSANIAILLPQEQMPMLDPPNFCTAGCEACPEPVNRMLVPYEEGPFAAYSDFDSYSCVLRGPGLETVNSAPTKQLWLITDHPEVALPNVFVDAVTAGPFRVHVSCPGCTEDLEGMHESLQTVVSATLGWAGDKDDLGGLAPLISMQRKSCAWDPGDVFPDAVLGVLEPDALNPEELYLYHYDETECESDGFFDDSGAVFLCPDPCQLIQTFPGELVEFYGCE